MRALLIVALVSAVVEGEDALECPKGAGVVGSSLTHDEKECHTHPVPSHLIKPAYAVKASDAGCGTLFIEACYTCCANEPMAEAVPETQSPSLAIVYGLLLVSMLLVFLLWKYCRTIERTTSAQSVVALNYTEPKAAKTPILPRWLSGLAFWSPKPKENSAGDLV